MINSELIRRLNEQRVTLARAARRAVLHAARQPSAHQGTEGADRRSRPPDPRRGGSALRVRSRTMPDRGRARRVAAAAASTSSSSRRPRPTGRTCELRALEREAKAQRDLLESYLAKYREATARDSLGAVPSDARIISRAVVSNTPYLPEEAADRADRDARDAVHLGRLHHHRRTARRQRLSRRRAAVEPSRVDAACAGGSCGAGASRWRRREAELAAKALSRQGKRRQSGRSSRSRCRRRRRRRTASELTIADMAQALREAGDVGKRVAVIGAAAGIGTTHDRGRARPRRLRATRASSWSICRSTGRSSRRSRTDPRAPGIADLVRGTASFGQIITRDRFSRVQVIAAGRAGAGCGGRHRFGAADDRDRCAARSYDHVIIDAERGAACAGRPHRAACAMRRAGRERACGGEGRRACAITWRMPASPISRCSPARRPRSMPRQCAASPPDQRRGSASWPD